MTDAEIEAKILEIIDEPDSASNDAGSFSMGSKSVRIDALRQLKANQASNNKTHGLVTTKARHVRSV